MLPPLSPPSLQGAADGELRLWDMVQHRMLSSTWAHSGAAGVYCVSTSPSLANMVVSQGRDDTCKCWEIEESGLSRKTLVTFRTSAYYFCKLSLVKSSSCVGQTCQTSSSNEPVSQSHEGAEPEINFDVEETVNGMCKEDSISDCLSTYGPRLMASAGEESQVKIWDLNNAERIMCFPQSTSSSLMGNSSRQRVMCCRTVHGYPGFFSSESQGFVNFLFGVLVQLRKK